MIYIFAKTEASVCHSPACRPKERRLFFQRCDGRSGSRDNPQAFQTVSAKPNGSYQKETWLVVSTPLQNISPNHQPETVRNM